MRLLAELDAFRKPRKETLNPRSKFGGVLLICTVATWGLYAGYSVRAYLNTPNKITTAVLPSSTVPDNLALFSIAHSNWGQVYLLPKFGKGVCSSSCNDQVWNEYSTNAFVNSSSQVSRILCPESAGTALLGFDNQDTEVTIPNGAAFVYGITNASVWDIYLDPNVLFSGQTPLADIPLFTLATPSGWSEDVSFLEGVPDGSAMITAPPGCVNFPITIATLSFKHTTDKVTGTRTTEVLAVQLQSKWVTLKYNYTQAIKTPCYSQGMNCEFVVEGDSLSVSLGASSVVGQFPLNSNTTRGFSGVGLVVVIASDTTVDMTVTSGRLPLTTMLGGLGGGFGAMMSAAGVIYLLNHHYGKLREKLARKHAAARQPGGQAWAGKGQVYTVRPGSAEAAEPREESVTEGASESTVSAS